MHILDQLGLQEDTFLHLLSQRDAQYDTRQLDERDKKRKRSQVCSYIRLKRFTQSEIIETVPEEMSQGFLIRHWRRYQNTTSIIKTIRVACVVSLAK